MGRIIRNALISHINYNQNLINFAFQWTVELKTTQLVDMTKKFVKKRRRGDFKPFEVLREQTIVNHQDKGLKMLDVHEKIDKEK